VSCVVKIFYRTLFCLKKDTISTRFPGEYNFLVEEKSKFSSIDTWNIFTCFYWSETIDSDLGRSQSMMGMLAVPTKVSKAGTDRNTLCHSFSRLVENNFDNVTNDCDDSHNTGYRCKKYAMWSDVAWFSAAWWL